ncbi:histidinol-phosphate transaminase [bacterium]|nr:histidinol-phosphate transaminase [bacterium]
MPRFRPAIERIDGYAPGEQPQDAGWTKLNTNENPYPPSPRVIEAIESAARGRLNIYPDPLGTRFRKAAGELFGVDSDWILPANGSDENLTIIVRSFADADDLVTFPYPSYILYETLADIQGARHERLLLNADWSWDLDRVRPMIEQSRIVFVPNPNSPSGNSWSHDTIEQLVPPGGVLVLDEAYGDFPAEPHRAQILQRDAGSRIIITRTLSKSYSLAGLRFGFAIAHPDVITGMRKVKDSYNCDTLSLAAATAAIEDQDWMLANTAKIRATRTRLTNELRSLGFNAVDSDANFVWTTHPDRSHRTIYEALKARRILVRLMTFPEALNGGTIDGLRITVGTDEETDRFLETLCSIVA